MTRMLKNNLNADIDREFDKKMIEKLKQQVQDLTNKLQLALTKSAEADYSAQRADSNLQTYVQLFENKTKENKEQQDKIDSLENTIINLNEALSSARKEINRLKLELNQENERLNKMNEQYKFLVIEKERKEASSLEEIGEMKRKIQELFSEKENLLKIVKSMDINVNNLNGIQKMHLEQEENFKKAEGQLSKYISENSELKRKLQSEENFKGKLGELLKRKKEKNLKLKEKIKEIEKMIGTLENEVKWNQDLVLQKDTQLKVVKEKIRRLEEENKKLHKINDKLRKKKISGLNNIEANGNDINDDSLDDIVPINPQPYLFGPEKDEDF